MTDQFENKRVTIIGLAREGTALARFLCGVGARVTVSDSRSPAALAEFLRQIASLPVHLSLGGNRVQDAISADYLFLSPGVPPLLPAVVEARKRNIPILSEPRLFLERCPAPVIGVTGSSGKTTTTSLIGEMLRRAGIRTHVGGNIGKPLIGELGSIAPTDAVVMELSSFQLALFDISPHIAVVTTLSPDHLDMHSSLEEYYDSKRNIVRFQGEGDIAVLNADDAEVRTFAGGHRGSIAWFSLEDDPSRAAYFDGENLWIHPNGSPEGSPATLLTSTGEIRLRGRHNIANSLAAVVAANAAGASLDAIREVLFTFGGVPHRQETVAIAGGVEFVNDSIATSPERTIAALETFDRPIRWLAGGRDKRLPLDRLLGVAASKPIDAYLYGETGEALAAALRSAGARVAGVYADLESAFDAAARDARPEDVVLLSPACTSFDQYRDYDARGQAFRSLVQQFLGQEAISR